MQLFVVVAFFLIIVAIMGNNSSVDTLSSTTLSNDDKSNRNNNNAPNNNIRDLPNLILMIVDELGTGDVPWADHSIVAPTIAGLAENGLRLGTQYAWQWCAPSRGALLSGRFPMHSGYTGGGMPGDGEGMDLAMPLLGQELKRAGYSTHMLGKWHLGFRTSKNLPVHRGFDTFFGLLGGGADHYDKTEESGQMKCGNITGHSLPFRVDFFDGDKPAVSLWDNHTYDAYLYTKRAVDLVMKHNKSMPFFLYWAPHKVHSPIQCPKEFLAPYPLDPNHKCQSTPDTCANRGYGTGGAGCGCSLQCYCNRRIIRGMVSVVDAMLANLTTALKTHDMWENTMIILLGDNGAPNNNAGSNGIFKGMKFGHYEGGHRVPAFIGGPWTGISNTLRGKWYNETVHLTDLHATLCDIAGVSPAEPVGVAPTDGTSLLPILNGSLSKTTPIRTELWIADDVLRRGEWKLITGKGSGSTQCMLGIGGHPVGTPHDPHNLSTFCGYSKCSGNETGIDAELCLRCACHSYNISNPKCTPCLYNVVLDPSEANNLANQHPDLVNELTTRIIELQKTTVHPHYPPKDLYRACKMMVETYHGFFGPWI